MKPINCYLQEIYEKLGGEPTEKRMSNYYYLDYILENIDSGSNCKYDAKIDWKSMPLISNAVIHQVISEVNVPDGVESLPNNFFSPLPNLKKITIPTSITSVDGGCWSGCQNLETVVLNWTESPMQYVSNMVFSNSSNAVFSIPKDTTAIYESANYPSDKLVEREE